ncbi:tapasin-like isoform X1 [Acipenser ruthenus]|uniref:tapasin-like isoform X1 n=1 Tax=Acipenser ruthenus TaxID=7906 RepID=UPI00274057DD|nr:tapasin-like isoform X1 [Acipenser ruthenus]
MPEISTVCKLAFIALICSSYMAPPVLSVCPVLDCWYVKEKPGSFPSAMTQEKSLLYIRTSADQTGPEQNHPADIDPMRVYHVSDPAGPLCSSSLLTVEGAVEKPQCEINPFTPQPAHVDWSLSLTSGGVSPARLGADWLSTSITAHKGDIGVSSILRVPTATGQATAVLSVFSHTPVLRSRLGRAARLDCGFSVLPGWQEPGSGFAVEWRYQFRGEGRLVYAYNGQTDRLEERSAQQEEASMDLEALHQTGNASLLLHNVDVHHRGTYICTVYLPYILAQVAMELEVIEPPRLSLFPSPLWSPPGRPVQLSCEMSGFYPLDVGVQWLWRPAGGAGVRYLPEAQLSGHTQNPDGTYTQTSFLRVTPESGDHQGQYSCIATHLGASYRKTVTLHIAGASGPSIEDAIGLFVVAFLLYGLLKLGSWLFCVKACPAVEIDKQKAE